jgi:hypothetical protein
VRNPALTLTPIAIRWNSCPHRFRSLSLSLILSFPSSPLDDPLKSRSTESITPHRNRFTFMRTTQKKTMLWKRLANAQAVNARQRPRRGIKSKRRADEPFQPPNGQKHLVCTKTPSNRQKEKYQNSRTSSRANGSERGGHEREKGVTDRNGKKKKGERRVCRSWT